MSLHKNTHLMDDGQLVAMGKEGCSEAIGELYKRHYESMVDLCERITNDREMARDVVHDGFIIICSNIGSLNDNRRFKGWMARIMSNLALQQVATRQRIRTAETEAATMEDTYNDKEEPTIDVLMDMINRLPHGYQKVFRLSVLEGLDHNEIARLVGIKPKSSASQLTRARVALRHMIEEWRHTAIIILSVILMTTVSVLLNKSFRKRKTKETTLGQTNTGRTTNTHKSASTDRVGHNVVTNTTTTDNAKKAMKADTTVIMNIQETSSAPMATITRPYTVISKLPTLSIHDTKITSTKTNKQQISLSLGGSTASAASLLLANVIHTATGIGSGTSTRGGISTWEELNQYITYTPPEGMNPVERDALIRISMMNQGRIMTRRHFYKPLTFDLTTSLQLSERWAIEGGLRLTRNGFEAVTGNSDTTNITRTDKTFYIGIPINVNYTMIQKGKWRLYATAGMAVDIPVWHSTAIDYNIDNRMIFRRNTSPDRPAIQWSANAGIGVGYEIAPHIELFFAPQATYHLPAGGTPTLWQEQRLKLSWPVGIRLKY